MLLQEQQAVVQIVEEAGVGQSATQLRQRLVEQPVEQ
jgi:hypothetical protein